MKNRLKVFLLFFSVIVVFSVSCKKEESKPNMVIVTEPEIITMETTLNGSIDGVMFDTQTLNCKDSYQKTTKIIRSKEGCFLINQGIKFKVNDSLSISFNIYIGEDIALPNNITIELIEKYFIDNPDKVAVDLEIKKSNVIYRNHRGETLLFNCGFIENLENICDNEILNIEPQSIYEINCFDTIDVLPIKIQYSGTLPIYSQTGENININNLELTIFLKE